MCAARKRFALIPHHNYEGRNLDFIHSNRLTHDRIMTSFASITIDNDSCLLFDWAEMDLEQLLEGALPPGVDAEMMHPDWMLTEIAGLADALNYLHRQITVRGRHIRLCHMDIKPRNILIMIDTRDPRGVWKITDFGCSSLEEGSQLPRQRVAAVVDGSIRARMMGIEGPYQPPESEPVDGRGNNSLRDRSDIWSLGCVVLRVLLYALGGSPFVAALDDLLYDEPQKDADQKNRSGYVYRQDGNSTHFIINRRLQPWLSSIECARWANDVQIYIFRHMLAIAAVERQPADVIWNHMSTLARQAPRQNVWHLNSLPRMSYDDSNIRSSLTPSDAGVDAQNGESEVGGEDEILWSWENNTMTSGYARRHSEIRIPTASGPSGHHERRMSPIVEQRSPSSATPRNSGLNTPFSTNSDQSGPSVPDTHTNVKKELGDNGNVKVQIAHDGSRVLFWGTKSMKPFYIKDNFRLILPEPLDTNPNSKRPWDEGQVENNFLLLRSRANQHASRQEVSQLNTYCWKVHLLTFGGLRCI